jgi:hypothetical protein
MSQSTPHQMHKEQRLSLKQGVSRVNTWWLKFKVGRPRQNSFDGNTLSRPNRSLGLGEGQVLPIASRQQAGSRRRKLKYALGFLLAYLIGYTAYDVFNRQQQSKRFLNLLNFVQFSHQSQSPICLSIRRPSWDWKKRSSNWGPRSNIKYLRLQILVKEWSRLILDSNAII